MREIALAHQLTGSPYVQGVRADTYRAGNDVVAAPPGGVEYAGHTRCIANNYSCNAPRAKGTDYCVGHLRGQEKVVREQG